MDRKYYRLLEKYDKEDNKRIFWIAGCPCVGKSFLVLDYIRKNYQNYFYIDFKNNIEFQNKVYDLNTLCSYFSIDEINLYNIPVIIDNVTDISFLSSISTDLEGFPKLFFTCNKAIDNNNFPQTALCCRINVYPLSFNEFLVATKHEWYSEIIRGHIESRKKIPEMIHQELLDLFDIYLSTGGMPEIIEEYIKFENTAILGSMKSHLSDSVDAEIKRSSQPEVKISGIISAVKSIYHKKNRKFMYSEIRKGLSEKQYGDCVDYLVNSRYLYKINRVDHDKHIITKDFRLYFYDFGIFNRTGTDIITANLEAGNNSLIENYIIQCLTESDIRTFYFESGTGAVVDFVIENNDKLIPIDVKLPGFKRSISVQNFSDSFRSPFIIRLGSENLTISETGEYNNSLQNELIIPIYALEDVCNSILT